MKLVKWRPTDRGNVEVLNETAELYRYFDATKQAEFLVECVAETINTLLPQELDYLTKYDLLQERINNRMEMPGELLSLLIQFLQQNRGKLGKNKRKKYFAAMTEAEVRAIEQWYDEVFIQGTTHWQ